MQANLAGRLPTEYASGDSIYRAYAYASRGKNQSVIVCFIG